jgi:acyl-CoA oxidase
MALVQERQSLSLDIEDLTKFLYRYLYEEIPLERVRGLREKMAKIPELSLTLNRYFDTREDAVARGLAFGKAYADFIHTEKLASKEFMIAYENSFELSPIILHFNFFIPSFKLQASKDQIEKWLPMMESLKIIGCYAQTELGHGSNVRGLEMQAIYDHGTKEFVFNSPTVTATKWWIGGLGIVSNFALVIAQLVIKGKGYGPHPFLVPIRDLSTHMPFEGVDVGDIGPKMGLHGNDNGYLRFSNYRVPKDCMLTRFSKINEWGDYEILDPNSIKILYLSLVRARILIPIDCWFPLSCALTIAIRYSVTRRQFTDPENPGQEKKIIDYQIQQFKLFRELSKLYAFVFAKVYISDLYRRTEIALDKGESSLLVFAHFIVCLYKVYSASTVLEGIEQCRRSCGGHGYMMLSGIPAIYNAFVPKVTYDGDNNILALQAIKYLISLYNKKPPEEIAFIYGPKIVPEGEPLSLEFQQQCFQAIAQYKVNRLKARFQDLHKKYNKKKIWNDLLQIEGIDASESVFYSHIHNIYCQNIPKVKPGLNQQAIEKLRLVYASNALEKYFAILEVIGVSPNSLDIIKQASIQALAFIRIHALGLIEAFEISDLSLHSVIGSKDGEIYSKMLETSKYKNPINKNKVFSGIQDFLSPRL